ncbi:MAG: hypothetical protein ACOX8H_04675 [Ruminococcus sp.]|jgi:hypothetical protein
MYSILSSKMVSFTYEQWVRYFQHQEKKRLNICFTQEELLDNRIKDLIFPSITAFERGENSDGAYLKSAAEEFSDKIADHSYQKAIELFIQEENVHSDYLAKFMKWHGVPQRTKTPLNRIFQLLRRTMKIRSEVTVLVTAEIIALSYYSALSSATTSKTLKSICRQMLRDELPHVIFQSYTLGHFKNSSIMNGARILLMEASCLAVWTAYGNVFRAGGYGFSKFLSESLGYLRQSIQLAERQKATRKA